MPRMTGCRGAVFVMCGLPPFVARTQAPGWDARITHTTAAIRLDGMLAEVVWLTADSVTAFMQSDPAEGRAGTERTVVRLLATPEGLARRARQEGHACGYRSAGCLRPPAFAPQLKRDPLDGAT